MEEFPKVRSTDMTTGVQDLSNQLEHWLQMRRLKQMSDPRTAEEARRRYHKEDRIQLYARLFLLLCFAGSVVVFWALTP